MGVPDEFSFYFGELDCLPIERADDAGVPVVGEKREFVFEVHYFHNLKDNWN